MLQTTHPGSDLQSLDSPAGVIGQDARWPENACEPSGHISVEIANHSRLKARILAHPLQCQVLPVHVIGRQLWRTSCLSWNDLMPVQQHGFGIIALLCFPDKYGKRQHRLKDHGLIEPTGALVGTTDDQGKRLESSFGQAL